MEYLNGNNSEISDTRNVARNKEGLFFYTATGSQTWDRKLKGLIRSLQTDLWPLKYFDSF
jgi:hypothetical protein